MGNAWIIGEIGFVYLFVCSATPPSVGWQKTTIEEIKTGTSCVPHMFPCTPNMLPKKTTFCTPQEGHGPDATVPLSWWGWTTKIKRGGKHDGENMCLLLRAWDKKEHIFQK